MKSTANGNELPTREEAAFRETEKQCRALGMAAERAAGRIRAMEWEQYQGMLLGIAHAAHTIGEVIRKADDEKAPWIRSMAEGDLDALVLAMKVLGWNDPAVQGPVN